MKNHSESDFLDKTNTFSYAENVRFHCSHLKYTIESDFLQIILKYFHLVL